MDAAVRTRFQFAGFTLDLAKGRLLTGTGETGTGDTGTQDVALRPKSFALLSHMVRNAGRVVSKDELMSTLWPDVTVSEDSLTQCVHDVRRALGPQGAPLLRTMPRRGYLFAGAVAVTGVTGTEDAADDGAVQADDVAPALRHDGIAVLPFVLMSAARPADANLLDGLVHDVITRLSGMRAFHIIARGSTFALRHLASDPQAAGAALGVAYAVAGQAQMRGDQVHLRVDLVQVADGAVIWAEEMVESRDRFLTLLGTLTQRIAQMVQGQVTATEARRAYAMPEQALDAWAMYHAGLYDVFRFEPDRTRRALQRFREAARLAPGFARAHAAQSFCHYHLAFAGISDDRTAEIAAARRTADDAMQADDCNPASNWAFGRALWLQHDPEGCLLHSQRAVDLCPGFAHAQYMIGFVETHGGDARRGLGQMDLVLSLSPFDPFLASVQITRAIALVRLGQVDEAAVWARDAARQPNAYAGLLAPAALILASAGRIPEARQIVAVLRQVMPSYNPAQLYQSIYRMSGDVAALFRKTAVLIDL